MPLTITGEGYRDFSEPRFFECETIAQVRQVRNPVDKSHALVAAADGSGFMSIYKFNATSVAADDGSTVLLPANPFFATEGRWLRIIYSGSVPANFLNLVGDGAPEDVVTGYYEGQFYTDRLTGTIYIFLGTPGTNTGWNP